MFHCADFFKIAILQPERSRDVVLRKLKLLVAGYSLPLE